MEQGLAALNRNYRRFRRGISALDDAAKLEFRRPPEYGGIRDRGPFASFLWEPALAHGLVKDVMHKGGAH